MAATRLNDIKGAATFEPRIAYAWHGEVKMKQYDASQDRSIVEIADVLGIQPDIVLEWIIEGRLLVAFQGDRTLLLVDRNSTLKNRNSGKVLILSNQICSERWFAFSC